jgi:hypothetical protein
MSCSINHQLKLKKKHRKSYISGCFQVCILIIVEIILYPDACNTYLHGYKVISFICFVFFFVCLLCLVDLWFTESIHILVNLKLCWKISLPKHALITTIYLFYILYVFITCLNKVYSDTY